MDKKFQKNEASIKKSIKKLRFSNCDCFYCMDKDTGKGEIPCEYANHHCEECHKKELCTLDDCLKEE